MSIPVIYSGTEWPAVTDVRSGVLYRLDTLTGTLTLPAAADVEDGVTFGAGGTEYEGNLGLPAENQVKNGVGFGANDTEFTGNVTLPAVGDVQDGVQYGASGTEYTGTLSASCDYPAEDDVRDGTAYGSGVYEGDLVLPAAADVKAGVTYGADGTEYTGTWTANPTGSGYVSSVKIGSSALLAAIYSRLTTHSSTSSYRTYNEVPQGTAFPYLRIGDCVGVRSASFETRQTAAEDNAVTIHIWSNALGDKECADMMTAVAQAITSSSLTITGYEAPMLAQLDYSELILDDSEPAEVVRHGVVRFRFHMAPSS